MLSSTDLQQTASLFPDFDPARSEVELLEKGGSDRQFFRITFAAEKTVILVKYGDQKEENRHYVAVARFLQSHGIQGPHIYFHDPQGLIWMEDLGEIDLWAHRSDPWEVRRPLYRLALEQAAHLHALPPENASEIQLQSGFDEALYLWEQNYFFENCLGAHFGWSAPKIGQRKPATLLQQIAARLGKLPRSLLHRDFQSQNIMLRDGKAWLIDFQGMRLGLAAYDVASLLYDPYVDLQDDERAFLLEDYLSLSGESRDFAEIFRLCALQRLMQALGAYGFLGHAKGKPEFLRHIPRALSSLVEVCRQIDGFDSFASELCEVAADHAIVGAETSPS